MGIQLRRARRSDIEPIRRLEIFCGLAAWEAFGYASFLEREEGEFRVAWEGNPDWPIGFYLGLRVDMELELLKIAVHPHRRRQGIGRNLLDDLFDRAFRKGCRECFLEVRPSNFPALAFYKRNGFCVVGVRKGYYVDPVEDALVLRTRCRRRAAPSPTDRRAGSS